MKLIRIIPGALALTLAWQVCAANPDDPWPIGPFTYQGRLTDQGGPANGPYDMVFSLYYTNNSSTPNGFRTNSNVSVANGLFTTVIDFGPDPGLVQPGGLELAVHTRRRMGRSAANAR